MAWQDNLKGKQLQRYKAGVLTAGQRAKTKEAQRAEDAFRSQYDAYLENTGQLNYQQPGYVPGVGLPAGAPGGLTPNVPNVPSTYTIKEGDTVQSIADANGTTPEGVLQNNPDVSSFDTGLVLQMWTQAAKEVQIQGEKFLPVKPGRPEFNDARLGGPQAQQQGLPSNAVIGQTTTNPQGVNAGMLAYAQSISSQSRAIDQQFVDASGNVQMGNPFAANQYGGQQSNQNPGLQASNAYSGNYAGTTPNNGSFQPSPTDQASQQNLWEQYKPTSATGFKDLLELGVNVPTALLDFGVEKGWLLPPNRGGNPTYYGPSGAGAAGSFSSGGRGGGGGRGRGGGGGGGGGANRNSTGLYPEPNQPQFSSAAGFRGLINWRI